MGIGKIFELSILRHFNKINPINLPSGNWQSLSASFAQKNTFTLCSILKTSYSFIPVNDFPIIKTFKMLIKIKQAFYSFLLSMVEL